MRDRDGGVQPDPEFLQLAYRIVLETVEAINITDGAPASSNDVLEVLPDDECAQLAERYQSPLTDAVGKILRRLQKRGFLSSVKSGRSRYYFVPGTVDAEVCADLSKPPRRRRVLALVGRAVEELDRAIRAQEVVDHAEGEGLTADIPGEMIKRDLANLTHTGELVVVDTVRGDGDGTNLYLPAELDPSDYLPDSPLTWLEELAGAFEAVWRDRLATAREEERRPIPPSTGDVRDRFRAEYPDHPRLDDPQLLVNGMGQLAEGDARVRAVRRNGQRSLLWAPVDVPDKDLDLGAAHASDTERLAEAVSRAMAALNVPAITVRDVSDQVDLDKHLKPAGKVPIPIHVMLSDLAREVLHNRDGTTSERVLQRVIRAGLVKGVAYYTVPGTDGVEEYLEMLRLRAEWPELDAHGRLELLGTCGLPSVRIGRARLLAEECEAIAQRANAILDPLVGTAWHEEVETIGKAASRFAAEAVADADGAVSGDLPSTPQLTSTGFTSRELGALIIPQYPLAGVEGKPSRLVPLMAPRIRRILNPDHERRFSEDPSVAAEKLFERVEALTYAAFRWGDTDEKYYANAAITTLGRLRDHRYVVPVLKSDRFEERQVAVACLAFLGDPSGELGRVADNDPDPVVRETAVWGLEFGANITEATTKEAP